MVNYYLNSPCTKHWNAVIHILQYIKDAPRKGSYEFCYRIGEYKERGVSARVGRRYVTCREEGNL